VNRPAALETIVFGDRPAAMGSITSSPIIKAMRPATFALWVILTFAQLAAMLAGADEDILLTLVLTTLLFVGVHIQFWYEESDQGLRFRRTMDKMRGSIYEDEMTGLPNSRHFVFELRRQMMRSVRNGRGFALVLSDLQGLEQRSHAKALPAVGKAIRRSAAEGDFVAHLEGPVFATLIVDAPGLSMSDRAAQLQGVLEGVVPENLRASVRPVVSLTSYQGEIEVRDFLRRAQRDLAAARERVQERPSAANPARRFSAA
jgi:GGDEF domain-containing protein